MTGELGSYQLARWVSTDKRASSARKSLARNRLPITNLHKLPITPFLDNFSFARETGGTFQTRVVNCPKRGFWEVVRTPAPRHQTRNPYAWQSDKTTRYRWTSSQSGNA